MNPRLAEATLESLLVYTYRPYYLAIIFNDDIFEISIVSPQFRNKTFPERIEEVLNLIYKDSEIASVYSLCVTPFTPEEFNDIL